jgi:hypothetical protein
MLFQVIFDNSEKGKELISYNISMMVRALAYIFCSAIINSLLKSRAPHGRVD